MCFPAGLPALIQTQHTVMVSVGNEACLNCRLVQSKDVLQVTWQKLSPEGERNVATFNKYYGQRVNADFRDKVEFKDAGLQNCSIVFRRVTEQDEGCYRCMFNTYPDGALKVSTCLRLYGKNCDACLIIVSYYSDHFHYIMYKQHGVFFCCGLVTQLVEGKGSNVKPKFFY